MGDVPPATSAGTCGSRVTNPPFKVAMAKEKVCVCVCVCMFGVGLTGLKACHVFWSDKSWSRKLWEGRKEESLGLEERGEMEGKSCRRKESRNKKTEKQSKLNPGWCISSFTYVQLRVAFEDHSLLCKRANRRAAPSSAGKGNLESRGKWVDD